METVIQFAGLFVGSVLFGIITLASRDNDVDSRVQRYKKHQRNSGQKVGSSEAVIAATYVNSYLVEKLSGVETSMNKLEEDVQVLRKQVEQLSQDKERLIAENTTLKENDIRLQRMIHVLRDRLAREGIVITDGDLETMAQASEHPVEKDER